MNRVCYPLVCQRVTQNVSLLFLSVKVNFCHKKSATEFLYVKTAGAELKLHHSLI